LAKSAAELASRQSKLTEIEPVRSLVPHGFFDRIFANLAAESGPPERLPLSFGSVNES